MSQNDLVLAHSATAGGDSEILVSALLAHRNDSEIPLKACNAMFPLFSQQDMVMETSGEIINIFHIVFRRLLASLIPIRGRVLACFRACYFFLSAFVVFEFVLWYYIVVFICLYIPHILC